MLIGRVHSQHIFMNIIHMYIFLLSNCFRVGDNPLIKTEVCITGEI